MDEDGGCPYLFFSGIIIAVLVLLLVLLIMMFRKELARKAEKLVKILKGVSPAELEDVTEEDIISMVNEGHEQGMLLASEAEMIHNIFEFGDKEVKDIMTHRKNVVAIDGELSYNDVVEIMIASRRSRFPVYLGDIDNIIGILHIKDALAFSKRNELFRTSVKDIPDLVREVDFIPETRNINRLFAEMQLEKKHMTVVVDEYGQTAGIVAMEDILEEIVGNIEDEHDHEEKTVHQLSENTFEFSGMAPFDEVVETLTLPLEKDTFDTLNGFLVSLLEKIPNDNETPCITAYGYVFQIEQVEEQLIRRVRAEKQQEDSHTGDSHTEDSVTICGKGDCEC